MHCARLESRSLPCRSLLPGEAEPPPIVRPGSHTSELTFRCIMQQAGFARRQWLAAAHIRRRCNQMMSRAFNRSWNLLPPPPACSWLFVACTSIRLDDDDAADRLHPTRSTPGLNCPRVWGHLETSDLGGREAARLA